MDTKAKVSVALLSVFGLAGLSACNTTSGLGQDIEAAGSEIEETAEETKDRITDDD